MEGNSVKWVRLGDYIEQCDERNHNNQYSIETIKGISTNKLFIDTKANLDGVPLQSYKLVSPRYFAYVPDTSRRGDKVALAFNNSGDTYLISSIYCVFKVAKPIELVPEFLYLFFLRPEFDRYARYNSWGSAREVFSWEDMCNILIPLPSVAEQQKVVNAWRAFREIKVQNEAKAAPLMQLCQSYIQELKHKYPMQEIGPYIEEYDERNSNEAYGLDDVRGISIEKKIIDTKANMDGVKLSPYKVFRPNTFCYVTITSRNGEKITLSLNNDNRCYIVSSSYITFRINQEDQILPRFLYLWFCRPEFDRYARFNSWGSAREAFSFEDMKRCKVPLPPIAVQQAIVNIYKCANEARQIAEEADRLSREVCPALLQHVIHS
ncbi:restriction endonuclease subunit S [Bacteroides gallinaceum]|uniref:restriction endonuclease subunit S n=1 Tax=Bacteroides gallinaceum TaxID=1462571 RepID=UPI0025A485B4|nr:restriction endonuclease subunit S [Bacteroides gallinaceum]MDM8206446.1 restriction endonuclease subunit S [Bacteroides gallinaceum]